MNNLNALQEKLTTVTTDITSAQQTLTNLNEKIREAKTQGTGESLRDTLRQASETSMLVQALRESETDLRGQISQLETEAQAERARQAHESRIKKFANAAQLANEDFQTLKDFEISLPLELRTLFKKRQDLTQRLKDSLSKFWNLGSMENSWDGYERTRETPPEVKALLTELKARVGLEGVFAKFGVYGTSSSLSNPAHFLSESYPVNEQLVSHFIAAIPPRLHQGIERLPLAKLTEIEEK